MLAATIWLHFILTTNTATIDTQSQDPFANPPVWGSLTTISVSSSLCATVTPRLGAPFLRCATPGQSSLRYRVRACNTLGCTPWTEEERLTCYAPSPDGCPTLIFPTGP